MAFESLALLQAQISRLGCQRLALEGLVVLTILSPTHTEGSSRVAVMQKAWAQRVFESWVVSHRITALLVFHLQITHIHALSSPWEVKKSLAIPSHSPTHLQASLWPSESGSVLRLINISFIWFIWQLPLPNLTVCWWSRWFYAYSIPTFLPGTLEWT